MSDADLIKRISTAFRKPGHPVAFSAPDQIRRYFGTSKEKAKKALEHIDSYVLHREYKKPRVYNSYFIYNRRDLLQADLIDIRSIHRENDGTKFLLLIIDVFTKKIWLYPLQDKKGVTMRATLSRWLNELRSKPKVFQTDAGTEFFNRNVGDLFAGYGIEQRVARGTSKASIAERANKSIQILIYKYLTDKETLRYIDVLPQLVKTYNRRGHRTLDMMPPFEADKPRNEERVRGIHVLRYQSVPKKKARFKLGDTVRIKTQAKSGVSSNRRAYAEQFFGEYYRIMRINRTMPVPLYYLKSMDSGNMLDQSFYGEDLTRVRGDIFKIENVIPNRIRGRGRNRQILVKFKYFTNPEWIFERDIIERY